MFLSNVPPFVTHHSVGAGMMPAAPPGCAAMAS
jgi:hypothetical protein